MYPLRRSPHTLLALVPRARRDPRLSHLEVSG
jgi:hypothetical protein